MTELKFLPNDVTRCSGAIVMTPQGIDYRPECMACLRRIAKSDGYRVPWMVAPAAPCPVRLEAACD